MTWLLSKLSGYLLPAVAIAFAVALLAAGLQTHRVKLAKAETQDVRNAWNLDRAQATAAMLKQTEDYRAEEQRRIAVHKEITDEADRTLSQARADAVIADAAAGRLQQRVAALVAQARAAASNPQAVQPSASTDDAAGVLADLQRRADERAGILARIADERGAAGTACEREYDALNR